jgi:hypothetical protein
MGIYNKVMLYFWLVMAIFIFVGVTVMGLKSGFERWYHFYLFGAISLLMFFVKKWMLKRMERHLLFLQEQNRQNGNKA